MPITRAVRMNDRKFSALAALAGARDSKATSAARLVLVDGKRKAQAARELGIDPAAVRRAVLRIEKTQQIIERMKDDD